MSSSIGLLKNDLNVLANDTKRKYPNVKQAVDKALEILQSSEVDEERSHLLVKPIVLACQTSSSSIITLSLSSLSRLINLKLVYQPVVSTVIAIIRQLVSNGFEIQLKILQILLSLFSTISDLHADEISECLIICFKLQDSKTTVVSSTASATVMQLILNVFERLNEEDKLDKSTLDSRPSLFVDLEDGTSLPVAPNAFTAHMLFADTITLLEAKNDQPLRFIKIGHLPTESTLELIESCLKNHVDLFKSHPSLLHLVKKQLYPIIQSMINDRYMSFGISTRVFQITRIILAGFENEMKDECKELWNTITDILESVHYKVWMKCLSLEITQSLFNDNKFVILFYQNHGKEIFISLLTAIARFVGEKAHVMGHNNDISGLGTRYIPKETTTLDASSYSYVGEVAAMMGTNTTNQANNLPQRQYKLNADERSRKLRVVDQRDKHDAPTINDSYSLHVALLIILEVCNVFKSIQDNDDLIIEMINESWPPLIASLSQYLNGEIDDELFVKCIKSAENMAVVSGTLQIMAPRDAFLGMIYGLACPTLAVTAVMKWNERKSDLGNMSPSLESIPTTYSYPPPRLSNRNHICLGVLINLTAVLSNTLGNSWFDVLETLQNAHYVLGSHLDYEMKQKQFIPSAEQGTTTAVADYVGNNIAQNSSDARVLYEGIEEIFKHSVDFNKDSLEMFVHALCRLSVGDGATSNFRSPTSSRRTSMEAFSRKSSATYVRQNESAFAISKIDVVGQLNVERLISNQAKGWYTIIDNLMVVTGGDILESDSSLRVDASEVLNKILISGLSAAQGCKEEEVDKVAIQSSVLNTLQYLSSLDIESRGHTVNNLLKTIRESALDTLHKCLENVGDSLVVEWDGVFKILTDSTQNKPVNEVKKAFEVVNLICNDFLDELSVVEVEKCVKVLSLFAKSNV